MKKPEAIKWTVKGYEPFLPIDSVREIEAWADGCPIIRDEQGHRLILARPEQYKFIELNSIEARTYLNYPKGYPYK